MAYFEQLGEVGSRMIFAFWNSVVVSDVIGADESWKQLTKVGHFIWARNEYFF